jgi:transcriptional regulator with XRE-family HTH domain
VRHRNTSSTPSCPHATPLQRFGATLRQYRQQRGLSHRALTARTGIRSSYISQIELGKRNISVLALLRLAHALDIPPDWLLVPIDPHATLAPPITSARLPSRGTQEPGVTHAETSSLQSGDPATLLPLLGVTIRQYRKHQGLTHKTLAARTGLSPTYIGEIELGHRNLSVLSLLRIAEALGLAVAHLLTPLETYQSSSSSPE